MPTTPLKMIRRFLFCKIVDGGKFSLNLKHHSSNPNCHRTGKDWIAYPSYYSSTSSLLSSSPTATTTAATVSSPQQTESQQQSDTQSEVKTVTITYVESDGKEKVVQAELGKHLLDVAHDNHVDLEGACGGELSCSTCHLIFEPNIYNKLPPKLDEEQDMLDLAFGVTETSRLGCQIRVTKELEGIKVQIPDDGF